MTTLRRNFLYGVDELPDEQLRDLFRQVSDLMQDVARSQATTPSALSGSSVPAWAANTAYEVGDTVYLNGVLWRCGQTLSKSAISFATDIASWEALSVGWPQALATERVVGKDWVNGNPIYEQSLLITLASSPGTTTTAHGITDIDVTQVWTELEVYPTGSNPRVYSPAGVAPSGGAVGVLVYIDNTNVVCVHSSTGHNSQTFYVIVRYQKA